MGIKMINLVWIIYLVYIYMYEWNFESDQLGFAVVKVCMCIELMKKIKKKA